MLVRLLRGTSSHRARVAIKADGLRKAIFESLAGFTLAGMLGR